MAKGHRDDRHGLVNALTPKAIAIRFEPAHFDRINTLAIQYKLSFAAMARVLVLKGLKTYTLDNPPHPS